MITFKHLLVFLAGFFIGAGIYQFLWLKITQKGYELKQEERKEEGLPRQSFLEFCFEYYNSISWKIRKSFGIRWFYNSKLFLIYIRLRGVIIFLFGVAIIIAILLVGSSEYAPYLDISL